MKTLSPAKINLMLRVLGQREDGYHILQTYFQLLDWGDGMQFDLLDSNTIEIEGNFGNLPIQDNLIYKAAEMLLPFRKVPKGIRIEVEKRIPQGSGLGGGSSNAGTTLRVLNELWQCELSQKQLLEFAVKLGADVPVFVFNKSAMAGGVGEKLNEYEIEKKYYVLIFPPVSISTADVFKSSELQRNQKPIETEQIHNQNFWTNACLPVVLNHFPEVKEIYETSSRYAPTYMSGTGSTLFTSFNSKSEAQEYINKCPVDWKMIVCHSQ
ncbi:MAG: 4-(cytidine 5'-diphospho)-2-C-methyl-D-erythritol kinase [Xanthomonadales bacterium]|nr:4-(cytidine 5'-diphospho)-2-C-methyl-D-erythritol kinase [Xanthomonadales bacterium]